MAGHFVGGLQVLVQQGGRHGQGLARIVESGGVGRVDGEFARGPDIHPGEVADRVVVFRVAQPARQHDAGIPGIAPDLPVADRLKPVDCLSTALERGLQLRFGRRHLARFESLEHQAHVSNDPSQRPPSRNRRRGRVPPRARRGRDIRRSTPAGTDGSWRQSDPRVESRVHRPLLRCRGSPPRPGGPGWKGSGSTSGGSRRNSLGIHEFPRWAGCGEPGGGSTRFYNALSPSVQHAGGLLSDFQTTATDSIVALDSILR